MKLNLKQMIKRIPLVGDWVVKICQEKKKEEEKKEVIKEVKKKMPKFTTSGEYWENRYVYGRNSGAGSYNNLAVFKGEIINDFIKRKKIVSTIELGCGDGNQLRYIEVPKYLGYDVSKKAVQLCTDMYKNDDSKNFKIMSSYKNEKADLTMSLDVIYHLIEDSTYLNYMNTLFEASNKYVIIYSSNTDENELNAVHVKHRKFTDWIDKNQQTFKLLEQIPNKYPFNGDGSNTSFADFYIFKKQD